MKTEKDPLISIIMPTWNRVGLTMQTIASVMAQTYPNWELIVVDDGSTDQTAELIRALEDPRIRFLEAGRRGIVGRLKNIGLANARGELIAFIDSDDLWDRAKLENQARALDRNPGAGFCLSGGYTFKEPGTPLEYFYEQKEGEFTGDILPLIFQSKCALYTQALLVKKEYIAISGEFGEGKTFTDIEFISALADRFPGVILFQPLLFRRLHGDNFIDGAWEELYHQGINLINNYRKKIPAALARQALFQTRIRFGEKCLQYRRHGQAASQFLKAWTQRPTSIVPLKKVGKSFWLSLKGK